MKRFWLLSIFVLCVGFASCGNQNTASNPAEAFGLEHGDTLTTAELNDLVAQGLDPDLVVDQTGVQIIDPTREVSPYGPRMCAECVQWTVTYVYNVDGSFTITIRCSQWDWFYCPDQYGMY